MEARNSQKVQKSGRTTAQIIAEAEATWMLPVLVGDVAEHGADCRCMVCFHKTADAILKRQEEDLYGAHSLDIACDFTGRD